MFSVSGQAIKCWECNSQYDHRCGEHFNNFTVALVDCDQRAADVAHIDRETMVMYNAYTPAEANDIPDTSKAHVCRKTTQLGEEETTHTVPKAGRGLLKMTIHHSKYML